MKHRIPDDWKQIVRVHVLKTRGEDRDYLGAGNFQADRVVRVDWPDRSFALFRYSFCLRNPKIKEVAVFTEHCGYYFLQGDGDFVKVTEFDQIFSDDDPFRSRT